MNKQEIYHFLNDQKICHEVTEHKAVFNMTEVAEIDLRYPEADAKNLFVRDSKRQHYCLIVVRGDKRVDLNAFRHQQGLRPLRFAPPEELMDVLQLEAGSVTPLGILNDQQRQVSVFLDRDFTQPPGLIGVHPNENTATVWLKTEDLIRIIAEHGNPLEIIDLPLVGQAAEHPAT